LHLPGVIAYALFPGLDGDESQQTFIVLLNQLLPSGVRGLVLASLVAALITSLIAVLNSVSTLVVRDFVWNSGPKLLKKTGADWKNCNFYCGVVWNWRCMACIQK
jgi:solute:Na+ symporter, SSS family